MKTFDSDDPGFVGEVVQLGFSEYVTASRGQALQAYGLGSSVAILLRDRDTGDGGSLSRYSPKPTTAPTASGRSTPIPRYCHSWKP